MLKRGLSFAVFCLALGVVATPAEAQPGPVVAKGYIRVQQPLRLIEHLVNHADQLLTAVNLTRANQYVMPPTFITTVQGRWTGGGADPFVWVRQTLPILLPPPTADIPVLVEKRFLPPVPGLALIKMWDAANPKVMLSQYVGSPGTAPLPTADFMVGQRVMDFRMAVINFYDQTSRLTRGMPALDLFRPVQHTYFNALSAVYFYVETLRRTYLIENPLLTTCPDKDRLIRRLVKMERIAFQIQEIMYVLRMAECFSWAPPAVVIEPVVRTIRYNVAATTPQPFIPFPYVAPAARPADERPVFPQPALFDPAMKAGVDPRAERLPGPPTTPAPDYNIQDWDRRFGGIEEGYIPPAPTRDRPAPAPTNATPATPNIPAPPTAPSGPVDY